MNAIHPLYIVSSIDYFKSFKMLDTEEAISDALLIVVAASVVVLLVELLEPERRLERADVAAEVAAEVTVSVAVSVVVVRPERSTLLTRFVKPFITEVLFDLFTRLSEPLIRPVAKSL